MSVWNPKLIIFIFQRTKKVETKKILLVVGKKKKRIDPGTEIVLFFALTEALKNEHAQRTTFEANSLIQFGLVWVQPKKNNNYFLYS